MTTKKNYNNRQNVYYRDQSCSLNRKLFESLNKQKNKYISNCFTDENGSGLISRDDINGAREPHARSVSYC